MSSATDAVWSSILRSFDQRRRRLSPGNGDLGALSVDSLLDIFEQAYNPLHPSVAVNLSSAVRVLRAPTKARREQLQADHEVAATLCLKLGMPDCRELRTNWVHVSRRKDLSADDLATLATLGRFLPVLDTLRFTTQSQGGPEEVENESEDEGEDGSEDEGLQRFAEGLSVGALPALSTFVLVGVNLGDAGALALADALDRGAMPRLENLRLLDATIGDAGLVALAPALRRRPALTKLELYGNPLGDEGLAALLAPPPPAGAPPPPKRALARLGTLDLRYTEVTDAGCATLTAALDSGALPALRTINVEETPATDEGRAAVLAAARAVAATAPPPAVPLLQRRFLGDPGLPSFP